MNIIFIVPPYRTTDALVYQLYPMPLAGVTLAPFLINEGHTVEIKDFLLPIQKHIMKSPDTFKGKYPPPYVHYGQSLEDCKLWIDNNIEKYDVACIFMGQCNLYETGAEISKYIKSHDIPVVIGGSFASTATEFALKLTDANIVVVGEGENVIVDAVSKAKKSDNKIIKGDVVDITKSPLPDWSLAPPKNYPKYNDKTRGVLAISRGCPHKCKFCSVCTIHSRTYRRQNKDRIKMELLNLWNHGVTYFCFVDDNLFIDEKSTCDLIRVIDGLKQTIEGFDKARFYVEEGIEVRVSAKKGLISKISEAGFKNIALGIETMNEDIRLRYDKPYNYKDLINAIRNCEDSWVIPKAFYIIGFEGDTVESVCEDLIELGKLGVATRSNNLKLYPGTDTTKEFTSKGFIDDSYDWRLSSFYTPYSGTLDFKTIRKLKTLVSAIGFSYEKFNIKIFKDDFNDIIARLVANGYSINKIDDKVTLEGGMYRQTPYRHMMEMLMLRLGYKGVQSTCSKNKIVCEGLSYPKNEIQKAIYEKYHKINVNRNLFEKEVSHI